MINSVLCFPYKLCDLMAFGGFLMEGSGSQPWMHY